MTEREYRSDDQTGRGYCPRCGQPLDGLTVAGKGYCDRHGWTWAEWMRREYHAEGLDERGIYGGRAYPIPPAVSDDDERNDAP